MKITLTTPIMHGEEEITVLDLREPNTGDVMACGYPLVIGDGEATPRADVIGALIARLASIPPSSVKQISLLDLNVLMGVVLGFFGK